MSENNPCKCATPSSGPTKSSANSFGFQMCDGDELVTVPASKVAEYIVNTIYGDSEGNPPSEGCYTVCFNSNGDRYISSLDTDSEYLKYVLLNEQTIFPVAPSDPDDRVAWGRAQTRSLDLQPPPSGFIPTHVKLRIWGYMGGSGETNILRDTNGNRILFMQGFNDDDDHSSFAEVSVPVQKSGSDYTVYITGDFSNGSVNIKQIGYEKLYTFNELGDITNPDSGDTPTVDESTSSFGPLTITYLNHVHNLAGPDVTTIEWIKDDSLVGTDEYVISLDLGETIHNETVTHVVGATSSKQRLVVNWTTANTVRIDAVVSQDGTFGDPKTSNIGTSDTIPVSFESDVTIA